MQVGPQMPKMLHCTNPSNNLDQDGSQKLLAYINYEANNLKLADGVHLSG